MLSPEPVVHYKKEPEAEPVKQLVGNLVVTSAPQNCDVEIDGRTETKNTPQLSIEGLAAGKHTISFSKPGYNRVTGEITIEPGAEVRVRGSLIEGRIDTLYEGKGSLLVKSKPNRCTIRFRGKLIEKDRPNFRMTHIPAGEYPMKISIRGRELSTNVLIRNDKRTVLEVSFVKGDKPFVVSYVTQ